MGEPETLRAQEKSLEEKKVLLEKALRIRVDMDRFILWGPEEMLRVFPPREVVHAEGEKVEESINNLKKLGRMRLS